MKRFRFRLAQLERLRQAEEEKEKQELRRRLAELEQAERQLETARYEYEQYLSRLRETEAQGVTIGAMAAARQYMPILQDRLGQCTNRVEAAKAQVAEQQQQLLAARRESQVLEKLRQRKNHLHAQAEERTEQNNLDELALHRSKGEASHG